MNDQAEERVDVARIFDCFIFFKELDLLEIRLHELDPVVDRFVLCEAPVTFRGQPKPLVFAENRDRFAPFLKKINHVVVDDMPESNAVEADYWLKQKFQRNAIRRGLSEADRDDFVVLSDVDEIPRAATVNAVARRSGRPAVFSLAMERYRYFVNLRVKGHWNSARMARFGDIRTLERLRGGGPTWRPKHPAGLRTLNQWRRMSFGMRRLRPWILIPEGGWHFTSMNGPAVILDKLHSISDVRRTSGINSEAITERIKRLLEDVSRPTESAQVDLVEIDAGFPSHLVANQSRFASLIADRRTFEQYGVELPETLRDAGALSVQDKAVAGEIGART